MLVVLRLVHVLAAIFWVGTGLFATFFLAPALGTVGPVGGQVMGALQKRGMFTALPVSALLTILSGIALLMMAASGSDGAYFRTDAGRAFSMSGGLAIAAFVFGMLVSRPATMRMAKLAGEVAAAADDTERTRLGAALAKARQGSQTANLVATIMIVLAAAGMAVARYV